MKDFYTPDELAEKAGVHPSYIRRLLNTGKMQGSKVGGDGKRGTWLIQVKVGDAWLEARKIKAMGITQERAF